MYRLVPKPQVLVWEAIVVLLLLKAIVGVTGRAPLSELKGYSRKKD